MNGTETITDGVTNPLLGDYAWYGGNNTASDRSPAGLKLPNGFGLYDTMRFVKGLRLVRPRLQLPFSTNDSGTRPVMWNGEFVQALSWECYCTTRGDGILRLLPLSRPPFVLFLLCILAWRPCAL